MNDPVELPFHAAARQAPAALHVILQNWFNAKGSEDPATLRAHFDPGFRIVSPTGKSMPWSAFGLAIPGMWGTRPSLVMEISDVELLHGDASSALISYVERQTEADRITRRIATALLLKNDTSLHPLWRHLQETWLA